MAIAVMVCSYYAMQCAQVLYCTVPRQIMERGMQCDDVPFEDERAHAVGCGCLSDGNTADARM